MEKVVELSKQTPFWDEVEDNYDTTKEFIRVQDYTQSHAGYLELRITFGDNKFMSTHLQVICQRKENSINIDYMIPELKQLLAQRKRQQITDPSRIPSAVLLPMYLKEGQYYLLLTKRTEKVREHKGQISFPGGVCEKEDGTLLETALRECSEEIGLLPGDAEILGALDDEFSVTTNYIISPFVALIPWPYRLRLNEDEIQEIIEAPVSQLLKSGYVKDKIKVPGSGVITTHLYYCQDKIIWGATARILNKFLDILVTATPQS